MIYRPTGHVKRQRGRPKYSRGSPAFGLTSYRPAQAHNLLGQFSDLRHFQRRCVCAGIAMAVAGGRFRHESCSLDLVSVIIAAGRRAGHVSIRSWRRDQRDRVQLITYPWVLGGSDGTGRGAARLWIPVARRVLNIRSVLASISTSASVFGNGRWQHCDRGP